jgi:AcrR family transcriptional regulator
MPKVVPGYKKEARNRIIQEATKLFLSKGYKKTKMTDVARNLGVSKGAIYQYFESKEDLLLAVIETVPGFRRAPLFSSIPPKDLARISSAEFFNKFLTMSAQSMSFGLELASEAIYNKSLREKIRELYERELDDVTEYFSSLKRKEVIKEEVDPRSVAMGLLALRRGIRAFVAGEMDRSEARKAWTYITRILMNDISVNS